MRLPFVVFIICDFPDALMEPFLIRLRHGITSFEQALQAFGLKFLRSNCIQPQCSQMRCHGADPCFLHRRGMACCVQLPTERIYLRFIPRSTILEIIVGLLIRQFKSPITCHSTLESGVLPHRRRSSSCVGVWQRGGTRFCFVICDTSNYFLFEIGGNSLVPLYLLSSRIRATIFLFHGFLASQVTPRSRSASTSLLIRNDFPT